MNCKKKIIFRFIFVYLIVLFLFVNIGFSEEKKKKNDDKWTPELSMMYKSISGTVMSPDGKYVAYVVREAVMEGEKSEYLSHIWVASLDGAFNVQYTRGEKSASNPSFSPDGKYLAFTSSRSDKNQIWIMRLKGGEAEQFTKEKNGVGSYKWSPDGKTIVFTKRDSETEEEEKQKKEKRDVILVDKNFKYNHLYTISVKNDSNNKRKIQRLTSGEFHITSFDWSPNGKTIVFAHQTDPLINTGFLESDISTVPADSGAVKPLVRRPGVDQNPLYSPNGKWITFVSNGGSPQPIGLRDVFIVSSDGGDPKKLADTHDRSVSIISWSADSKKVYYSESFKTTRDLFSLPINGNKPEMITTGDGVVGSIAFNKDTDKVTFIYQNTNIANEVYYSEVKNFNINKLTDINSNVPKPSMGKTELISWKSKDGLEIEGLLTYPVNYQPGRKYPLILNVHGGPAGVFSQSYTGSSSIYMIQTFAQEGYAILRPNPRGSTGYGKEFRYANYKDWGFGDYEDLMSGVDEVIKMGVGHSDSLCLMGWSYGGYMTSFSVTRTDRFKAASMGAGLPNLVSMVTTTDIPDYLVAHMGSEFWEDYKTYEKHSAIYRIKNVTIPTQVIHGANDLRVPFTQGQEFYVALKRKGVPTEMIVYPRTPHGPREPKLLMDVTPRILSWFEKHLRR